MVQKNKSVLQRDSLVTKLNQITDTKLSRCLVHYDSLLPIDNQKYFYKYSYNEIINAFSGSRTANIGDWAKRIALTYSWLAKIPTPNLDPELLSKAHQYENAIRIALQKTSSDNVLEVVINKNLFKDYYYTINKIINNTNPNRLGKNLSSVTKVFHFTFPELFIIVDKNTRPVMIGNEFESDLDDEHYRQCTIILHEYINSPAGEVLKKLAHKSNLTPIRLLDIYFFHQME